MTENMQPDAADNTAPEALQGDLSDNQPSPDVMVPDEAETDFGADSEVFPRDYVERLRRENAGYRQKAKDAEQAAGESDSVAYNFAQRLHTAMVAATGKLADPTDLGFHIEHLTGDDAINEAVDALLAQKPHLRSRKPSGNIGQGHRGHTAEFSLLDILKSRA